MILAEKFKNYADGEIPKKKLQASEFGHGMAYLAQLGVKRNEDGKVSPSATIKKWLAEGDIDIIKGIMNIFRGPTRSKVLAGTQTLPDNLRYSALVPLVLSAFKEYEGIDYEEWDWTDPQIFHLLCPNLKELVAYITDSPKEGEAKITPSFKRSELIEMAEKVSAIEAKPLDKVYRVTNIACPELTGHPYLFKIITLQVWIAHPKFRNKYMILSTEVVDGVPEALEVETLLPEDPFAETKVSTESLDPYRLNDVVKDESNSETDSDIPWEA